MNAQTACRPIAVLLNRMSIHSASCQEKSAKSRLGKRLLSRVTIYKRERRFSRSETGFSLPSESRDRDEVGGLVGKLIGAIGPEFGKQSLATGAVISAQHIYVKSDAPRLDQESMEQWEASKAAEELRGAIIWLINRADPPRVYSEVPTAWWDLALELRATSPEEPDPFAFAYFIWSVMAEEGSTIDGI
jgi:hypothetical protein